MRKMLMAGLALVLLAGPASAQYLGNNNGNSYRSTGSTVYGSNSSTGSTWTNSYSSGGNQRGTDSQGNSWSYNRGSGVYQNYGTGETRIRGQRW